MHNRLSDAVGPPAPNVDLRIAPDGEVQFKSPGMFVGYFREPDKTREALTEDGYVKTGDAGYLEPDGQLKIVDRAKDVGRLTNGQMFAPKYIENKLKFFPNIREAVAIGDGRDFVAAKTSSSPRSATGPSATTFPMLRIRSSPPIRASTR